MATYPTFDGQSALNTDVLVKSTWYGDANLDGKVDGTDYSLIDHGFNTPGASGWINGDFNYDGKINGSDYSLIDNAFNTAPAGVTNVTANPGTENGSVDVAWTYAPPLPTKFEVQWASDAAFTADTGSIDVPVPAGSTNSLWTSTVTDLSPDEVYYFRVVAVSPSSPQITSIQTPTAVATVNLPVYASQLDEEPGDPVFDPFKQIVYTFTRKSSDTSQDIAVFYRFGGLAGVDRISPGIDLDTGDPATQVSGTDEYEFDIPAGSSSATLTFTPISEDFWSSEHGVYLEMTEIQAGSAVYDIGAESQISSATDIRPPSSTGPKKWGGTAAFLVKFQDGSSVQLSDTSENGFINALQSFKNSGKKITELAFTGHGNSRSIILQDNQELRVSLSNHVVVGEDQQDITTLLNDLLTPNATIYLQACNTGRTPDGDGTENGHDSLAAKLSSALPGRTVVGFRTAMLRIGRNSAIEHPLSLFGGTFGATRKFQDGHAN